MHKSFPKLAIGAFGFISMLLLTASTYHMLASGSMKKKAALSEASQIIHFAKQYTSSSEARVRSRQISVDAEGMYFTNLSITFEPSGGMKLNNMSSGLCDVMFNLTKTIDLESCKAKGSVDFTSSQVKGLMK